jgi:GTP-binding protein
MSRLASLVFHKTDISIATRIVEDGRALVILVNKMDLLSKQIQSDVMAGLDLVVKHVLPSVRGVPLIPISAKTRQNLDAIFPSVVKQFDRWTFKVGTFKLNRWLKECTRMTPPPRINGRPTKIRFVKQTHTRPPSFCIFFSTSPENLPESYVRFLMSQLREDFGLHGIPVRVTVKKTKNPYADEATQERQAQARRIL